MNCAVLVEEQEREFLRNQGDPSWLNGTLSNYLDLSRFPTEFLGIEFAPKRLSKLQPLSALLAYQPFYLTKERIDV